MTKLKASVTSIHRGRVVHDGVARRVPPMPKSIAPELASEYRALMRQLVAMPDWNHARLPLVEAYLNALQVLRGKDDGQKLPASNALLRLSKTLGIVSLTPSPLRPAPMVTPKTMELFGEGRPSTSAPWTRR